MKKTPDTSKSKDDFRYRTIKIPLANILVKDPKKAAHATETVDKVVEKAHRWVFHATHLIQLWLLHKCHNNIKIPDLKNAHFMMIFTVLEENLETKRFKINRSIFEELRSKGIITLMSIMLIKIIIILKILRGMFQINSLVKKTILSTIGTLSSGLGRKCSQETEHYLDKILEMLDRDSKWCYLEGPLSSDTYKKKFYQWVRLGVFTAAHQSICQLLVEKKILDHSAVQMLYMDSSDVMNKLGSVGIGYSAKFKSKKATKINVIVNQVGIPLSIQVVPANQHDSSLIRETLERLSIRVASSRKYPKYLIVDKGYINLKIRREEKRIHLVYPLKKRMDWRRVYNYHQFQKMKKMMPTRSINENFFAWLKTSKRMNLRYDKKLSTFEGFIYLKSLQIIDRKI